MIFENIVQDNKEAFVDKVRDITLELMFKPEWLMFVMWFETAKTLQPRIQNTVTKATGLIQFMPATAKSLGTSVEALVKMSNLEQLDYVRKYFLPYKGKIKCFTDAYLVVFFPTAIGQPDSFVIETRSIAANIIAKQNPIFDLDKDGKITKGEIKKRLVSMVPVEYKEYFI